MRGPRKTRAPLDGGCTLALPAEAAQWSLTTLRERLVKIGARIVRHGRSIDLQMAEVMVQRGLFKTILGCHCGAPPVAAGPMLTSIAVWVVRLPAGDARHDADRRGRPSQLPDATHPEAVQRSLSKLQRSLHHCHPGTFRQ